MDVHFGEAIAVRPFAQAPREHRRRAESELTDLIHRRLVALTPHVEDAELEATVRDLFAVYAGEVMAKLPESEALSRQLRADQEIIRAVQ